MTRAAKDKPMNILKHLMHYGALYIIAVTVWFGVFVVMPYQSGGWWVVLMVHGTIAFLAWLSHGLNRIIQKEQ